MSQAEETLTGHSVIFVAPFEVVIEQLEIPRPGRGEVLITSHMSAISSGTEMLAYKGQWPADLQLDEHLSGLQEDTAYPLKYGYAVVGSVTGLGEEVDSSSM